MPKRPFALFGTAAFSALVLSSLLGDDTAAQIAFLCLLSGAGLVAFTLICRLKLPGKALSGAFFSSGRLCRYSAGTAGFVLCFGLLCAMFAFYSGKNVTPYVSALSGLTVRLHGTALDYPESRYGKQYVTLRVDSVSSDEADLSSLNDGSFVLRLSCRPELAPEPGDSVECTAKLYEFSDSGGLYSTQSSRLADGIVMGGYLTEYENWRVIENGSPGFFEAIKRLRHYAANIFESALPQREAGFMRALLLGEQYAASSVDYGNFRSCGASHLLVISGVHMSVISSFIGMALGRMTRRRRLKGACACLAILLFLAVIGFPPSAVRSGVMQIMLLLSGLFGRKSDSLNSLGAAVLIICLFNPFSGGDLGFALSAFATLGIVLCAGPLKRALDLKGGRLISRALAPVSSSIAMSLSAVLFTLPVQAAVFGGLNLLSPLSTFLLMLPVELSLGAGLLAIVFPFVKPFLFVCGILSRLSLWLASVMARLPGLFLELTEPAVIAAAAAAVLFCLLCAGKSKKAGVCAAIICLSVFFICTFVPEPYGGGSVVLAAAEGSHCVVLISGTEAAVLSLGGYDTGAAKSLLERKNVRKLSFVFLSDMDAESREAAQSLIYSFSGAKLCVSEDFAPFADFEDCDKLSLSDGESLEVLPGIYAEVHENMQRIELELNGVSVIIEGESEEAADCDILFTENAEGKTSSAFTVMQNSDIINEGTEALSAGSYVFPGENGLYAEIAPDGAIRLKGESECLSF